MLSLDGGFVLKDTSCATVKGAARNSSRQRMRWHRENRAACTAPLAPATPLASGDSWGFLTPGSQTLGERVIISTARLALSCISAYDTHGLHLHLLLNLYLPQTTSVKQPQPLRGHNGFEQPLSQVVTTKGKQQDQPCVLASTKSQAALPLRWWTSAPSTDMHPGPGLRLCRGGGGTFLVWCRK